jgi:hypothetical protein
MPRAPRLGFTKGCADAPQNMGVLVAFRPHFMGTCVRCLSSDCNVS